MTRRLSTLAVAASLFAFPACGDDDDGPGGVACDIELISVELGDDGDLNIRARNDTDVSGQLSFAVLYSENGVQNGDQGIGVANDVAPGVTVDIETVGGFQIDEFDCASLRVTFISTQANAGIICNAVPIGDECYN